VTSGSGHAVADALVKQEATRDVFWHISPGFQVLWYALAGLSILVFAYGICRLLAKYLRGQPSVPLPRRELPRRVVEALRETLSHATVAHRDPYAGWAHAAIFYGFVILAAGSAVLAIDTDITEPIFGWRFFQGSFYDGYSLTLDVMGVVLLSGVLAMMVRRAIVRPPKLDYTRPDRAPGEPGYDRSHYRIGDWVFVGGLLYLLVTGFLLEGARLAMDKPARVGYSAAGWLAGQPLVGLSHSTLATVRMTLWWSHGLIAISLVAAIPYTKAMHMLTGFGSLVLRDREAGKRLEIIPPERATAPAGYGTLADFSRRHLLHLDACTRCGRCHEACPANATGQPLSPRDVILELREGASASFAGVGVGGVLGALLGGDAGAADAAVVGPEKVRKETVWACMQCNACVEACPVGIEQAPIINALRRRLVEDGELPAGLQSTLQVVRRSGNSFGENRRRRGAWAKELDFPIKDARKGPVDVLWFVGDYASFDPRSQGVSRAIARLYHAAAVDFGILYDGEHNAGNDVRRAGEEGLWEMLASHNIDALRSTQFRRIVTSDPHSLNTLRNEYPDLGGAWPVSHHTGFLLELIESGRLAVKSALDCRVTYHDPCYLGRYSGEYDAPRRILELIGAELVEMPRNRDNSFCCGAGGGRIWIRDESNTERPSENRIREAVGLGDLDYFVVSCPKDVTMYEDAIKTSGNADRIELREVAELILEALEPTAVTSARVTRAGAAVAEVD
jgi:Fe-S oxidoreductase